MARRVAIAGAVAIVVGGIILVLLALAGRAVYSRAAFGTWDPAAPPTRISYCNRTYLPGSHVTRIQINADGNSLGTFRLRQVGATADGKPIVAKPLPDNVRHKYGNASPLPCAMVVYLKLGDDDYVAYGLSGGP
jgi:hypothetical protein